MKYVLRRLAYLVFILLVVTFLVSAMLELMPGDPAIAILGDTATESQIEAVHQRLRLDDPVTTRYVRWLADAVRGDLGSSVRGNVPMTDIIKERLPVTVELVIGSQILALLWAVPTAVYGAYRPRRTLDTASSATSMAMISIPHFVLGLFLILILSVQVGWFPVAGFTRITEDPWENIRSMILPMMAVGALPAGVYQRLLRNDMQATLREDYIAMAEAKGLSMPRVLFRHALRPSLFSLITLMGITIARAIGGSVVVETIFSLPGLGRLLIDSIQLRDMVAIQAVVFVIAVAYVVINGFVDILYGVLDPRVRRDAR